VVSNPVRDIIGVVIHAYPVNQNPDTGKWRPANFSIETETDEVYIKQFPTSHWDSEQGTFVTPEPITMPAWYDGLISAYGGTMQGLEGLTVQIKGEAKFNKQRGTVEYEVVGQGFTVLDEAAPTPKENTPVPTAPTTIAKSPQTTNGFEPGPRDAWSAAGQSMGNSRSVIGGIIQAHILATTGELPSDEYLLLAAKKVKFGTKALLAEESQEVDPVHDIPKPTEQYDIDIATRGKSDLPNPHEVNSDGSYCDSTMTWRKACGCTEANVLDNNHNVCKESKNREAQEPTTLDSF